YPGCWARNRAREECSFGAREGKLLDLPAGDDVDGDILAIPVFWRMAEDGLPAYHSIRKRCLVEGGCRDQIEKVFFAVDHGFFGGYRCPRARKQPAHEPCGADRREGDAHLFAQAFQLCFVGWPQRRIGEFQRHGESSAAWHA